MTKRKNCMGWLVVLLVLGTGLVGAHASAARMRKHTADMGWWRAARFGMFIHWGLYSEAAGYWHGKAIGGQGPMIESMAHVPKQQFAQLAKSFNPTEFSANKWVSVAKAAGMKYLVFTCKHHGGFCMFRTKATRYNVVDATPWHTDPSAALAKACTQQGIRFCAYYSVMDWHTPYQMPVVANSRHPTYVPMKFTPGGQGKYLQYMQTQLGEIITQYHPSLIWFDDSSWGLYGWNRHDARTIFDFVRRLDPTVIMNNRLDKWSKFRGYGDYRTPEGYVPRGGLPGAWETCMTMNDTWGYKRGDHNYKTVATLLKNLIKCASGGGNFLLDVGPTGKGVIPQPQVQRLLAIGHWLKTNGDAIYNTHRSPFGEPLMFGYATCKPGLIYLEVTRWPHDGKLLVPPVRHVTKAWLLAEPSKPLHFDSSSGGVVVEVPAHAPDKIASVVVLRVAGQ